MTNVKHNLKEDPPGLGAPVRGRTDTHLPSAAHEGEGKTEAASSGSSQAGAAKEIEPQIKSATSSTVVCGGGCIAAAQRAAAGGCPGCECPAGNCKCTKCGHGDEGDKSAAGGSCSARPMKEKVEFVEEGRGSDIFRTIS
ncbi:hypothetical protein JG688_00017811 [Phytophthora aleatoria]|uniref:Uncharacterized protein n=1 Tax=Phytophthora aleatoria TaxID=2496075 RepID=A0A8J5IGV3_9STRA|nr:hypothetical protein JG688_00017811 [Phytophthora aleatoria]